MNDEQKSAWILSWKPQMKLLQRVPEEDALAIFKYQRFLKTTFAAFWHWMKILADFLIQQRMFQTLSLICVFIRERVIHR